MEAGWSTNNNNVPIRLKDLILSCKYHLVKKILEIGEQSEPKTFG